MERNNKTISDKIILYSGIGVAILSIIVIALLMYSKNLSDEVKDGTMSLEELAKLTENNAEDYESASTEIGKSVEESKNELDSDTTNTQVNNITTNNTVNNTTKTNTSSNNTVRTNSNVETKQEEKSIELSFEKPVDGDIIKEFAKDNLIYSETLKEWTTHMGVDIKAEKTTVVKSAEAGTVKSIKNDPRYGLTIVVEHANGFQTVYANLLTSEFVVEGEKIEKGQSIGTVGNTAVFESADEPHLHFEILKDSMQVDPSIYIK